MQEFVRSTWTPGAWTEGDNLQTLQTEDNASYRNEVLNHLSYVLCCTYRILRDVTLQVAHTKIVRAVEHTAVRNCFINMYMP